MSSVVGTKANIGLWMARELDKSQARLGYRILRKGVVAKRSCTIIFLP